MVSIVEAISMCGGFGANAAQNAVTVKRTVDGKPQTLRVRAGDMALDPNVTPFEVLPGDAILVVPSDYEKSTFTILGQVARPGLFQIPEGAHLTIIDAISLAGGFTLTASQNDVAVKRMVKGNLDILTVRAKDMEQDPNVAAFEVLPGDSYQRSFPQQHILDPRPGGEAGHLRNRGRHAPQYHRCDPHGRRLHPARGAERRDGQAAGQRQAHDDQGPRGQTWPTRPTWCRLKFSPAISSRFPKPGISLIMKSWEQDEIEKIARAIWQQQGCPEGRGLEHWYEAEEIFRAKWLADQSDIEHQVRDLRVRGDGH